MKNLVITVQNHEAKHGQNYRALNAELGGRKIHSSHNDYSIANFTEKAIEEVIHSAILNGFTPVELTVDAPLSAGAKTTIADKYSGDPLISSITFA